MFLTKNGTRTNSGKIGIVITDGVSNIEYHKIRMLHSGKIGIVITDGLNNTKELGNIAGSLENRININDFEELDRKIDQSFRSVCNEVLGAIKKAKRPSQYVAFAETKYCLRNVMFTPFYGDRRNTQKIAVMESDGQQSFDRVRVRNEIQKVNKA
ncbi:hypothetical protein MAR_034866 [Mya arenaria]|uniref:VWFA domain-containing protein n=1 Tax=Mya arenaria TaxID=6604 RepID=A0ABY7EKR7_MYAAR|nr:hypothetical protein MAR_034866 [Mya arenaria]